MTIIAALLIFGFIVFIHELGHFLAAKINGVTVLEFAIGMGPKIFSIKKETEYIIKLFPIGGYCLMEGEDNHSANTESFNSKSIFQRASILLAGPLFNIILAIIVLIPVFMVRGTPTTTINSIDINSPAYVSGINVGDQILYINGHKISHWEEVGPFIQTQHSANLAITIERNGQQKLFQVTPVLSDGVYKIGISPTYESHFIIAIKEAILTTGSIFIQMILFLMQLFTGLAPSNLTQSMTGPLGIIQLVEDATKTGLTNILYLTSIISLNLGVMNLLPIPALDGGRLVFLIIETLRGGKKINPHKEGLIHFVGFTFLMGFTIFITCQDLIRIIS